MSYVYYLLEGVKVLMGKSYQARNDLIRTVQLYERVLWCGFLKLPYLLIQQIFIVHLLYAIYRASY